MEQASAPDHTGLSVSYVHGHYPVLTETFIDREIQQLIDSGVDLTILSIRPPNENLSPVQRELSQRVTYVMPVSVPQLVAALASAAFRRPGTFFGTLGWLLTRRHAGASRFKTFVHFVTGVHVAWLLRHRRGIHMHAHFVDRAATVALVASRLLDTGYSVTAHAREIYVEPALLPERIANSVFTATCTEYNRAHLARLVGPEVADRIHLLYHGLNLDAYTALTDGRSAKDNPPLLLAVAQLWERKGLRYLIEACRHLRDAGQQVRCVIVGDGPLMSDLARLVADEGLEPSVTLAGWLSHPEVLDLYRRATLFVLPCIVTNDGDRDGIPNVILEAMAARVPVVSTGVSGIPEVIRDGETGLLVPERDPSAIATAVARLLGDRELTARITERAQQFVTSEFDLARNVEGLLERFEAASAERGP